MKHWYLAQEYAHGELVQKLGNLDAVFALDGELISRDPMSHVLRVNIEGGHYYVKRYAGLGKRPLRRLLDRPRVQSEWQNLQRFAAWGIPTAPLVAYGLEQHWGRFMRGALITREIVNTTDLKKLAVSGQLHLKSRRWQDGISHQLAVATRKMHVHGFAHNDLKWRNLLVDNADDPALYLIDCPNGKFWRGPFLSYRIVKDLACLDKVAKYHLTRTQRLRFYLDYAEKSKLDTDDKQRIRKIIGFFEGRE